MMRNRDALRGLCNAIASSFYPDNMAIDCAMEAEGIDPDGDCVPKDMRLFNAAMSLVKGYVEEMRNEGVSVGVGKVKQSVRWKKTKTSTIERSIRHWCKVYGVEAEQVLGSLIHVIYDGSGQW